MSLLLVIKLLVVVVALLMFLRRPSLVWGIGLLSVTTAVLLDTFLGVFDREALLADLGFFFYIIGGVLFAGSTLWAWGVMRPALETTTPTPAAPTISPNQKTAVSPPAADKEGKPGAAFDRQMLYDELRHRLGYEDILDLIFDLGLNENDVMTLDQDMNQLIVNVMDQAEANGQTGALALAVERILTPPPPENLPRLEKINIDSPATILRHYLLAHFNLAQLRELVAGLDLDWEQLGVETKQTKVRNLLLYLYRRNRIDELIDWLQETADPLPEQADD